MKIISMATPSHRVLEEEWFRPSLRDACDVEILHVDDAGDGEGVWCTPSYNTAVARKTKFIADSIAAHMGETLVWADVDIQFFKPVLPAVEALMGKNDMLFQRGHHLHDEVCTGFFACRANRKTLLFWRVAQGMMRFFAHKGDQAVANVLLGMYLERKREPARAFNPFGIAWDWLPDGFYCPGVNYSRLWHPGDALPLPADMYLHHANWTVGIDNKIAQFRYVRQQVEQAVA